MNWDMLGQNAEEIIEKESLEKKLKSGRKLRVKFGADPTAPDLHLGHAVVFKKLRELQDSGHRAVFIIGDYTAKIGDPSGRNKTRPPLSDKEIKKNAKTYFEQAGKVIDIKAAEIRYNSEWFSRMKLEEFIKISGHFSVRRIMDREDFKKRLESGGEIAHHETIYQIMQAYDSVAISADVEIGGRDQKLNMLAGRELQRKMGLPEQDLVIMPLLLGLDGKEKMSKSLGNFVALEDSAEEMFGKIMSIPDSLIPHYAGLAAFWDESKIRYAEDRLRKENPRDVKLDLAGAIVSLYHGEKKAVLARERFLKLFSRRELGGVPEKTLKPGDYEPAELLSKLGLVKSKSEARRLIQQGAVELDGRTVSLPAEKLSIRSGMVLRVGKRKFLKIK